MLLSNPLILWLAGRRSAFNSYASLYFFYQTVKMSSRKLQSHLEKSSLGKKQIRLHPQHFTHPRGEGVGCEVQKVFAGVGWGRHPNKSKLITEHPQTCHLTAFGSAPVHW